MNKMEIRKTGPKGLRQFGLTMAIMLSLITAILLWRQMPSAPYIGVSAILFALAGLAAPKALKPLFVIWMMFAYYLSMVMTYIVLTLFYYIVITPFAALLLVFRKDILSKRFPGRKNTYWIKSTIYPDDIERYSKPF